MTQQPKAQPLASNVTDCALIFEGGGYRAAYTAGFARVLLEQGIYFDFVCGISAGASHTVDYVSRDLWRTRFAFLGERPKGVQINGLGSMLRGDRYFNADYLYEGCVEDGFMPFDWKTFCANPAQVAVQSFESDTGRSVTLTKDDMPDMESMMHAVRASSTLPGMMKPIRIDGHVMYDGGLGQGAGIPLHLAEDAGYKRFFFVATRPRGYRKLPPTGAERRMLLAVSKGNPYVRNALLTRWERYNVELTRLEGLAREGKAYIVYPDEMPLSSGTTDTRKLHEAYDQGHAQGMRELPRWRKFLFGSPDAGPKPDPKVLREVEAEAEGYITISK